MRISILAIASVLQIASALPTELGQESSTPDNDVNAAPPSRMRSRSNNRRSSQQQQRRRAQKGAEESSNSQEPYDPFIGLVESTEQDSHQRYLQDGESDMSMPTDCTFCPLGLTVPEDTPLPQDSNCGMASQFAASLNPANPVYTTMCPTVQMAQAVCCPPQEEQMVDEAAPLIDEKKSSVCSCSPTEYNFELKLDRDCETDDLDGKDGIGLTFCFLGSHDSTFLGNKNRNRQVRGLRQEQRQERESQRLLPGHSTQKVSFGRSGGEEELTDQETKQLRQLANDIEIISIQFLEFDTSGELIVLNQDDTYANTSLTNGDVATFKSISSNLDPELSIEEQLDYLPGGVQVTLRGRVVDDGDEKIVSNRITWSYTNDCDAEPVEEGDGIGWVEVDEIEAASAAFCPATATTTTTTTATTTTEAIEEPEMCSFCPDGLTVPADTPLPQDSSCGMALGFAATLTASDDMCPTVQFAEALCCPPATTTEAPPATTTTEMMSMPTTEAPKTTTTITTTEAATIDPCSFCPNGIPDSKKDIILSDGTETTCRRTNNAAKLLPSDDDQCPVIQAAEAECCPEEPPTTTEATEVPETTTEATEAPEMCAFCPDGLSVTDDFPLPTNDGATCGTVQDYAATLTASDDLCLTVKMAEILCCPPAKMCSFCPDGLTVPADTPLPDNSNCGMALGFAATLTASDDMCPTVQFAEALCCPPATTTEAPPATTTTEMMSMPTTEAPKTTTEAPEITTEAPKTTTEAPVVTTTEAPKTTTEAPATTTEAPKTTTEAPVTTTEAPAATTQAPEVPPVMGAKSSKAMLGSKSAKSKQDKPSLAPKTNKTPKNPMAKVTKEENSNDDGHQNDGSSSSTNGGSSIIDAKSGKAKVDIDAKAEKQAPPEQDGAAKASKLAKKDNGSAKSDKQVSAKAGSKSGKGESDVVKGSKAAHRLFGKALQNSMSAFI